MVLESLGTLRTEAALRDLCDCTPFSIKGLSDAVKLVNAAQALGLAARKHRLGFSELSAEVHRGLFPIVNVVTRLTDGGKRTEHAVVVVRIEDDVVEVNDPWRGIYNYAKEDFIREWSATYGLAILIEPLEEVHDS